MSDGLPPGWEREHSRRYRPSGRDEPMGYVTFVHASGDLRLRVAPAAIDGDSRPGYTLCVTRFPGRESSSSELRYVLTFDRGVDVARRFMALFSAVYDDPGDLEAALEYATRRVGDPDRVLE